MVRVRSYIARRRATTAARRAGSRPIRLRCGGPGVRPPASGSLRRKRELTPPPRDTVARSCFDSGQHEAAAFPEADPHEAGALAPAAKYDFIAVSEEGALFARGQPQRLCSASGEFEQTSALLFARPGDGPAGEQVAGAQIATVAGVVRDELRRRPVHGFEAGAAEPVQTHVTIAHGCGPQIR